MKKHFNLLVLFCFVIFIVKSQNNWVSIGPTNYIPTNFKAEIGLVQSVWVHPSNPSIILIGSHGGGVFKTINGGESWYPVDTGMPAITGILDIKSNPTNHNEIYI